MNRVEVVAATHRIDNHTQAAEVSNAALREYLVKATVVNLAAASKKHLQR